MYLIDDRDDFQQRSRAQLENNSAQTVPTVPASAAVIVPEEVKRAFRLAVAHYQCPADEIPILRALLRADLENAVRCYLALEAELLGCAKGINERIRAVIAETKDA